MILADRDSNMAVSAVPHSKCRLTRLLNYLAGPFQSGISTDAYDTKLQIGRIYRALSLLAVN